MTLAHAEALAMLDQLEERLKLMKWREPHVRPGQERTMADTYGRMLAAVRSDVKTWYQAVYVPGHPDDTRCVHGIAGCPECGNPFSMTLSREDVVMMRADVGDGAFLTELLGQFSFCPEPALVVDRQNTKHLVPCVLDTGHEGPCAPSTRPSGQMSLTGHDCSKNGCDNPELMARYT